MSLNTDACPVKVPVIASPNPVAVPILGVSNVGLEPFPMGRHAPAVLSQKHRTLIEPLPPEAQVPSVLSFTHAIMMVRWVGREAVAKEPKVILFTGTV